MIKLSEKQIGVDVVKLTLSTGVYDVYGREVGGVAYVRGRGDGYEFWVQSARDGKPYGAVRPSYEAPNYETARAGAARRLDLAGQRVRAVAAGQSDGVYRTGRQLKLARTNKPGT